MSKKTLYILLISLAVFIICMMLLVLFSKNGASTTNQTTISSVKVKSFIPNPVSTSSDQSILFQSSNFDLIYFIKEQKFQIDLLALPLTTTREQAQQELLDYLQISQSDACKLNVLVKTSYSISPSYAGLNLGLGFCPNSVTLN